MLKKLIAVLLAVTTMILGLAACSSGSKDSEKKQLKVSQLRIQRTQKQAHRRRTISVKK